MKKTGRLLMIVLLIFCSFPGCVGKPVAINSSYQIGLITMMADSRQRQALETGMQQAAADLGVTVYNLSRGIQGDEQLAIQIRESITAGCQVLVIHAADSPAISGALQEAVAAGIRVIAVDCVLTTETALSYWADHRSAGRAAGEAMVEVLQMRRIQSGAIGILLPDEEGPATQMEEGFREALQGTAYMLQAPRYDRKNGTLAQSMSWDFLKQGAVGIFAGGADGLLGAGSAVKTADSRAVVVGCGISDEVQPLLEDGVIRTIVQTDYAHLGYESINAAASLLRGEKETELPLDGGIILLESKTPVLTNRDYQIALIARDPRDRQWQSMKEGAEAAAGELGCRLQDLSAQFQNKKQQAQQIEQAVSAGFHAIITATGGSETVSGALKNAMDAGVRVICVEVPEYLEPDVAIRPDYQAAGRRAAEAMLAQLEAREIEKGAIGIIGIQEASEESRQLEAGFRAVFAETAYTLLETQFAEGDAARAHLLADSYFWKKAKGIFCCDEASLLGAGNVVDYRDANMIVVGFGASDGTADLLEEGEIRAAVTLDAKSAGDEAVKAACASLRGELPAGSQIDAPVYVLKAE